MLTLAVTGHRPDKLGGYSVEVYERLTDFAAGELAELAPDLVITGMALGWDMAIAEAARSIGLPYHAYVPFKGQQLKWPKESQDLHRNLLKSAQKVVYCSGPRHQPYKMHKRNEMMIEACDTVLAMWNGDNTGGTAAAVRYARLCGKEIINSWNRWAQYA